MGIDKPFRTYEELICLLKEKNLIIDNEQEAILFLKKYSYFDIINGYKKPFKDKETRKYKRNTRIEDIFAIYNFDNELRFILLKSIMIVEKHIKSLLSYSFTEEFGCLQKEYLDTTNYNYSSKNQTHINSLVQILGATIKNCSAPVYIKHQNETHDNVPLWVLKKSLTFGSVSKIYSLLQPQTQTRISKEFYDVDEHALSSMLKLLSKFRNVCAHNERLYKYQYHKHSVAYTPIHSVFNSGTSHFKTGKNDLFAVLICLKYLLGNSEFEELAQSVDSAIGQLTKQTYLIQPNQLLKMMGFPTNWKILKDIDLKELVIKTHMNNN